MVFNMKIIAHRGAPLLAPENTLKSFRLAKESGLVYFELDVHLSKDGQLVVTHDESLKRVTGRDAFVKDLDYKEIFSLDAGEGEKIPLLAEVMKVLGEDTVLNIEIKTDITAYPGIEEKVLSSVKTLWVDWSERVIISSFNFNTLINVRALDETVKIGLLTREFNAEQAERLKAFSLNMSYKRITKDIVNKAKEMGLEVWIYTINNREIFAQMKELGADAVFTDNPYLV